MLTSSSGGGGGYSRDSHRVAQMAGSRQMPMNGHHVAEEIHPFEAAVRAGQQRWSPALQQQQQPMYRFANQHAQQFRGGDLDRRESGCTQQ